MSLFFRSLSLLCIVAFSTLQPLVASAAETSVTRGTFIMKVIDAFDISPVHKGTLPYKRVPAIQRPYIQAAYDRGALAVFTGTDLQAGRAITRGEAAQVLAALGKIVPAGKELSYQDVPAGSVLAKAVTATVEQQWFKPLRPKLFGADRTMTPADIRLVLARVVRSRTEAPAGRVKLKTTPVIQSEQTKVLNSVWELLQKDFLYEQRLDPKKANYSAAETMVKTLNDPYTVFFPPAESKQFQDQIAGEVTGIGVQVEVSELGLLIVAPLPNSPAEKAGIKARDIVIGVDGVSLKGMAHQDAINKVRGPKGSTAKVKVLREGVELEFTLTRDTVKVPEVAISWQGNVAVVKIAQFGEVTENEIRADFTKIKERSPTGIIIDLRNNPGGLLTTADELMSVFLPAESIVSNIHTRTGEYTEATREDQIIDDAVPMAVLINKGSASASEIVAGAFQDYKRATVIGEKSFGKGTVQQIVQFKDGSSLKMTIAEWKTPSERKIDGVGVQPDIAVDSTTDPDAPLKRALDLLR